MTPTLRPLFLVLWLLGLVGLSSCGADPRRNEPADTVHLFLVSEIRGLDPAQAQEATDGICCLQIYDTLYEYHYLKRPYALTPCLATGQPTVSATGLVHTIKLKQGVFFHDDPCFPDGKGREMTAHDVVFSILRLMDPRTRSAGTWLFDGFLEGLDEFQARAAKEPRNRTRYETVKGIRAIDRHTVQFRLTKEYPQLKWVLAMTYASVVPWEAIQAYGDEFLNHPVGTGPFVVEEFKRTQRLALKRNPTYRDDFYPTSGEPIDRELGRLDDAGKRLPLSNHLVFTVYKEPQPRWLDFLLGDLDRAGIPKDQFDTAIDPTTRRLRADLAQDGIALQKTPSIEIIYDAFNMRHEAFGQPNGAKGRAIRRAMSLAFDEAWSRTKLYNDRLDSVQGLLVPEFPEHDPDFVNPWKQQPGETRENALIRACALLDEAGYTADEDGIRTGIPPLYYEVTDSASDDQFFQAFKRDMKDVGIRIKSTRVTWQQMVQRIRQGDSQIWGIAWTADYPDAQNFLMLLYGPNRSPGPNGANYENPAFDRLYAQAKNMLPGPERTKLYREMERIAVDDCPWIFKYRRVNFDLVHSWLFNFKRSAMQDRYGKYLRVDPAVRAAFRKEKQKPNYLPLWLGLAAIAAVLGATLWGARRKVRAW